MKRYVVAVLAALILFAATSHTAAYAAPARPAPTKSIARVIELVNVRRAEYGLKPLVANRILMAEAQRFSAVQARIGGLSHRGVDGTNAGQRLRAAGYNWRFYGENLAAGQETPEAVVAAWMRSPSHRAILLHARPIEIGIGYTYKKGDPSRYFDYWVMEVGRPR
jgi:uncharacterized protein YkwD